MKNLEEIQEMLISELFNNLDRLKLNHNDDYNKLMGDTSFLLAGYLHQKLKADFKNWDKKKWIDDSLLTKIIFQVDKLFIWGVVIWGIENLTAQWTEPFYFEAVLNNEKTSFEKIILFFGDENCSAITYEDFNINRNFWDREYYSNKNWNPTERSWKYRISNIIENSL